MREEVCLRYRPLRGPPERLRFVPRDDGRWARFDEYWSGCCWHTRGHEVVEAVALDATADSLDRLVD